MEEIPEQGPAWRMKRRAGIAAIVGSAIVGVILWIGIYHYSPPIPDSGSVAHRLVFALKCIAVATLFCLVGGIEAVAHERLQSAAFDPLQGFETRRLRVNLRYLQNTLEQLLVFIAALLGLAIYMTDGQTMRAVLATTIVWIAGRFAFWLGYHRSAAMRGLGVPGVMASLLALLYVAWRIGNEIAAPLGGPLIIGGFLLLEAVLFWKTRS